MSSEQHHPYLHEVKELIDAHEGNPNRHRITGTTVEEANKWAKDIETNHQQELNIKRKERHEEISTFIGERIDLQTHPFMIRYIEDIYSLIHELEQTIKQNYITEPDYPKLNDILESCKSIEGLNLTDIEEKINDTALPNKTTLIAIFKKIFRAPTQFLFIVYDCIYKFSPIIKSKFKLTPRDESTCTGPSCGKLRKRRGGTRRKIKKRKSRKSKKRRNRIR